MNLWVFEDDTVIAMFADADRVARKNFQRDRMVSVEAQQVADEIGEELQGRGFVFFASFHDDLGGKWFRRTD